MKYRDERILAVIDCANWDDARRAKIAQALIKDQLEDFIVCDVPHIIETASGVVTINRDGSYIDSRRGGEAYNNA